jgi:phosphate:Na+ symporter
MEMGFILSDLLTNFERVADHCSNIAVCMIEMAHGSFETHEYLNHLKNSGEDAYVNLYNNYKKKYVL